MEGSACRLGGLGASSCSGREEEVKLREMTGVRDPRYICTTKRGGSSPGPAQDSSR